MRKALIIGGGVAGPTTAMALAKAGIEAEVYEAHRTPPVDLSTYLTVAVNGLGALRAIDAHEPVCAAGFPTRSIVFFLGNGKAMAQVNVGAELPDGTVTHTIKRTDLQTALHDEAARRGIRFHYGKRFVGLTETEDGVTASFDDGSKAHGDFLVGCDGVHSTVRAAIDPAAPPARYTGLLNVGGFNTGSTLALAPGTYQMTFGKRAFFGLTVSPAGHIWWFANPSSVTELSKHDLATTTTEVWRKRLIKLFAADRGPAADIVRGSEGPIVASNSYELATVPHWHTERVVIVGDAAHAASPAAGQGASMAMEDAVLLAKCVRDLPAAGAAFAAFQELRRARAERVVAQGARSSKFKAVNPVARIIRDRKLPAILQGHSQGGEHSLAWIHGYRVDWEQPVGS